MSFTTGGTPVVLVAGETPATPITGKMPVGPVAGETPATPITGKKPGGPVHRRDGGFPSQRLISRGCWL